MTAMRIILCLLPLLFLNSACTHTSGYRQTPELTLEKLDPKVSLGHVEIDDQGELISFDQLKRVTAKIEAESTEPLLMVVYIHGWNHNASERLITGAGDLHDFREMLKDLGEAS